MSENTKEIFVDQLDRVIVGYPVSKVQFSSVKNVDEEGNPVRECVLSLAISTEALLKMCKVIVENAEEDFSALLDLASKSKENLESIINQSIVDKKTRKRVAK